MNLLAILPPWTGYAVPGLAIMSNAQRSANQPWRANENPLKLNIRPMSKPTDWTQGRLSRRVFPSS